MQLLNCLNNIESPYQLNIAQKLILQTLLNDEHKNIKEFSEWLQKINVGELDRQILKILPALYEKLKNKTSDTNLHNKMKPGYEHFSEKTQSVLDDGKAIIKKLAEAGIEVLVFKGAALHLLYYKNHAVRPMSDVDVLVKKEDIKKAKKIILENNWKPCYTETESCMYLHSYDYKNENDNGFDLHWYALYESPIDKIDKGIWQRAKTFDWEGTSIKVMAPEDMILVNMIHAFRDLLFLIDQRTNVHNVNWINDIAHILKTEKSINWNIIYQEANQRGKLETVLYAMAVVHSIADSVITIGMIQHLFASNPEFQFSFARSLINEGRMHSIKPECFSEVQDFVSAEEKKSDKRTLKQIWQKLFGQRYQSLNLDENPNKYTKYYLNDVGNIVSLYLSPRFIPHLKYIFKVQNKKALKKAIKAFSKASVGYLNLGSGVLALKDDVRIARYKANVKVKNQIKKTALTNEVITFDLEIKNTSGCYWVLDEKQEQAMGLSYHLLSSGGECIRRGFFRTYFFQPREGYVNYIPPSQKINCKLSAKMPSQPGNYGIQLDIVHENNHWFSEVGVKFPKFLIQVNEEQEG